MASKFQIQLHTHPPQGVHTNVYTNPVRSQLTHLKEKESTQEELGRDSSIHVGPRACMSESQSTFHTPLPNRQEGGELYGQQDQNPGQRPPGLSSDTPRAQWSEVFKSTRRQFRLFHPLPEAGPLLSWCLSYTFQGAQDGRGHRELNTSYRYRGSCQMEGGSYGKSCNM